MLEQQSKPRATARTTKEPGIAEIAAPIYTSWVTPNGQSTPEHLAAKAFDAAEAFLTEHRRRTA